MSSWTNQRGGKITTDLSVLQHKERGGGCTICDGGSGEGGLTG